MNMITRDDHLDWKCQFDPLFIEIAILGSNKIYSLKSVSNSANPIDSAFLDSKCPFLSQTKKEGRESSNLRGFSNFCSPHQHQNFLFQFY